MSSSCTVPMLTTITILAALCGAAHTSPVVSLPPNELAAQHRQSSNFVAPVAITPGPPTPKVQDESRNQVSARNIPQDNTHAKHKFANNLASSQLLSGIQQPSGAHDSINLPTSMMASPSWNQAQPPNSGHRLRDPNYGQTFNDNSDRLIEGSGAGPPPAGNKNQKVKLDDTDESGDDDEEDYDDSSEPVDGKPNHVAITTPKPNPPSSATPPDTIKRPTYNDFYNPFRPATTNTLSTSGNSNFNQTTRPTASPASFAPHQPANVMPTLPIATSKRPSSNFSSAIDAWPNAAPPSNLASKNKTETDYDYEDENIDEELDETSVFEDNDTSDTEASSKKNHASRPPALPSNQLATSRVNATRLEQPKVTTTRPPADIARPTDRPRVDVAPRPTPQQPARFDTVTSQPHIPMATTPSATSAKVGFDDDDEEEEEEQEEEVEEDEEEDEGEGDMDDGTSDKDGLPEYKGPLPSSSWPGSNGTNLQSRPAPPSGGRPPMVAMQPVNTHEQSIPSAMAHPSQGLQQSGQYQSPIRPAVVVTTLVPSVAPNAPAPTVLPPVLVPSPATTPDAIAAPTTMRPASPPTMMNSEDSLDQQSNLQQGPVRSPTIFATTIASTTLQPRLTTPPSITRSPPPYAPAYYPTTIRPFLMSTLSPTRRVVSPPIVTTTNIQPYSNNDDSLTRQIYDKAVEAYHEADRTVRAALEAVWPPNFDFDYSTIEPLLAQPIFFMLALGGAIICLVLLMMLIVFMISYQTKPQRYEHDDISIY